MVIGFLGEREYHLFNTDAERRQAIIARLMVAWHLKGGDNAVLVRAKTKLLCWVFDPDTPVSLAEIDAQEEMRQSIIEKDEG